MTPIEHHRSNDRIQAKFKNVKWFSLYTFAHSDWYIHKIKSVSADYTIRFLISFHNTDGFFIGAFFAAYDIMNMVYICKKLGKDLVIFHLLFILI